MKTDTIIEYNFLAQNLNALNAQSLRLGPEVVKTGNILKSAELNRIKHDMEILTKAVSKLHTEIFTDLQDELGEEFQFLLRKKVAANDN